jgi:CheY-like chemotaxis protein
MQSPIHSSTTNYSNSLNSSFWQVVKEVPMKQLDPKPKILLIEDDRISQIVAQRMLEKMGYEVSIVDTGTEALEVYTNYDLIVSDLGLPDISGIEICNTIRSQAIKNQIPMVALTANYGQEKVCKKAGFNNFLQKPVIYEQLKQTIEELLAKKN